MWSDGGWRAGFGFGAVIALCTGLLRRYSPQSPRWLLATGNVEAAEAVVENVEKGHFEDYGRGATALIKGKARSTKPSSFWQQNRELIVCYPGRVALGSFLDFSEAAGYYGLVWVFGLFFISAVSVAPNFISFFYLISYFCAPVLGILRRVIRVNDFS